jgi:hypothetical protein
MSALPYDFDLEGHRATHRGCSQSGDRLGSAEMPRALFNTREKNRAQRA